MPRTPAHTVQTAPEPSRDAMKMLEAPFGRVLNIHGEMAHSPAMLNGYAALQGAIREHGTFDPATRQAIALAVAAVDDCSYCEAAHTVAGRAAGLSVEMTIAARTGGAGLDPRLAALLAVAREYTANTGTVADGTWAHALEQRWSDAELTELAIHITVNLLTNDFNHFVHTDFDLPAAPEL